MPQYTAPLEMKLEKLMGENRDIPILFLKNVDENN